MDKDPTAIMGFSRCPVSTIILMKYQISKKIITVEATLNFTKGHNSLKANTDNPFHPSLHHPTIYATCAMATAHADTSNATIAPSLPHLKTSINRYDIIICTISATNPIQAKTPTLLCGWETSELGN